MGLSCFSLPFAIATVFQVQSVQDTLHCKATDAGSLSSRGEQCKVWRDQNQWCAQGGAAAADKQAAEGNQGGGRFRAIIDTVIGNLQLSITNVHIRFEVCLSFHPESFMPDVDVDSCSGNAEMARHCRTRHQCLAYLWLQDSPLRACHLTLWTRRATRPLSLIIPWISYAR